MKEIQILKDCDSTYVVGYVGSYMKDGDLWIVMEYCAAGSLTDLMTIGSVTLSEPELAHAMAATLLGLKYLHTIPLIHRDMKAGNILLTDSGVAKLADFGVSTKLQNTLSKRNSVIGTPFWMAPEVIQQSDYVTSADIWSLGITAIELADGEPPYANIHPMRAIFMIPNKDPPTVRDPTKWSAQFSDFLAQCLVKDPASRPSAATLLEHPFVAEAAAEITGNDGSSSVLKALAQRHMPAIEQARREDMEYFDEEEGAPEGDGEANPKTSTLRGGTLTYKNGTMIKHGTLVKASAIALATAEAKQPSYLADIAAAPAPAPAPAAAAAAASDAASASAPAAQPAATGKPASAEAGGRDIWSTDVDFLSGLTAAELRVRVQEVDAAFRSAMAELTTKYDAAKGAVKKAHRSKK